MLGSIGDYSKMNSYKSIQELYLEELGIPLEDEGVSPEQCHELEEPGGSVLTNSNRFISSWGFGFCTEYYLHLMLDHQGPRQLKKVTSYGNWSDPPPP